MTTQADPNAAPPPPPNPPPPPSDPPDEKKLSLTQQALNDRLDQAKRSANAELLATLGVKDPAEAKAKLDALRATEDAQKTEAQRQTDKIAALEPRAARADVLEQRVSELAALELGKLPPEHKAFVEDMTKDPAEQLRAITALQARGVLKAGTPGAALPPPAPPGANTTGAGAPPPAGGALTAPSTPEQHRAEHDRLVKAGALAQAANYMRRNGQEIAKSAKN